MTSLDRPTDRQLIRQLIRQQTDNLLQLITTKIRDTGNINEDRNTQREITDWDTGTQITTGRYK